MASQRKSAAHLKYTEEYHYKRTSHVFLQEHSQKTSFQDAREAIEGILTRVDRSILYKEFILNSALGIYSYLTLSILNMKTLPASALRFLTLIYNSPNR